MNQRKTEVSGKFATPIWTGVLENHEEINKNLLEFIFAEQKKNPEGTKRSNVLGWHSPDFDLNTDTMKSFFIAVSPMIKEVARDLSWDMKNYKIKVLSCWSIINKKFASNSTHIHSGCDISSAYYVSTKKECGRIVFEDPRPGAAMTRQGHTSVNSWNEGNMAIEPQNGLLVMFPSYLGHYVQPNMSVSDRIMVSFNLGLLHNKYWSTEEKSLEKK